MAQYVFEVFKTPGDRYNWEILKQYYAGLSDLDNEEKRTICEAIDILKEELGTSFLKHHSQMRNHSKPEVRGGHINRITHPIVGFVENLAPHNRLRLIWLADALVAMKASAQNYRVLKRKIESAKRFRDEGYTFLWIADNFRKAGFDPTFLVESKHTGRKTPDLFVKHSSTEQSLYLEVTQLKTSQGQELASGSYYRILNTCMMMGVPFAGKLFEAFEEKELTDFLENRLVPALTKVRKEEIFIEVSLEETQGKLALALDGKGGYDRLQHWAAPGNYEVNNIASLPIDIHLSKRIRKNKKLKEKALQIYMQDGGRGQGIVFMKIDYISFWCLDYEEEIFLLEKELKSYPWILGVYFHAEVLSVDPARQIGKAPQSFYADQHLGGTLLRSILYVANPHYEGGFSNESMEFLKKALLA